ncbi:MAG: hypothetical protein D4R88_06730 [Methanosarcinales archaeon]|nr:MAG: hypothetical protein D4R88_06730 [Methanosarcinales archaeon]
MKIRLREITMAGIILLVLAFTIGMAGATGETPTVNITGTPTITLTATATATSTAVAGTAEDDDYKPDKGLIGPGNALYGLRIAFQHLDIVFTFNRSEKLGKQVSYARHRIKEFRASLADNDTEAANIAIEEFKNEIEEVNKSVSEFSGKDTGLANAQKMIAKHQAVLEALLESHPNNSGLQKAYKNSLELEDNFAEKTKVKYDRKMTKQGRVVLEEVEIDNEDFGKEKTQVKASVEDNKTHVKVELKFLTNSTEPADIAADISDKVAAIKNNISGLIKIERDGKENDEKDNDEAEPEVTVTGGPTTTLTTTQAVTRAANLSREKLKAEAEVKGNTTRVMFEYTFFLNVTEDPAIITGVQGKLSALTVDQILSVLDVKVKENTVEIKETKVNERKNVQIDETKQENKRGQIEREDSK